MCRAQYEEFACWCKGIKGEVFIIYQKENPSFFKLI